MEQITVRIHHDDGVWWAESPSLPGFSSAADSLAELRSLVREGIEFALGSKNHIVVQVGVSAKGSNAAVRPFPEHQRFLMTESRATSNAVSL